MAHRLTFLHSLYHWTLRWAAHEYASWALFMIAFVESSFFLIPPDVLLIPMALARPHRWLWYVGITTVGSVLGGILGYYIGYALWDAIGEAIVGFYHLGDAFGAVQTSYQDHAFLTIFTAAFTPIPYKVITIASGLFQVSLGTLAVASFIGRGLRFLLIGGLVGIFGERMKLFIEKYFDLLTILFLILFVGGFIVLQWIL